MKNKLLYIPIFAIFVTGLYFFGPSLHSPTQKCPDDYTNDDAGSAQKLADIDKWTNDFYDAHPGATLTDWSLARHQYWIDNNCTEALKRYEEAKTGKADPVAMKNIQAGIQEAVDSQHYVSNLGFSFNYPKDMFVMEDPDGPRLIILSNSYKTDKSKPMTAVVISAGLNDPQMTPLAWLKGPNSGADMTKGYTKLNIDGQEAVSMNGDVWIVVNTPNNKRQLSIATLPSVNPSKVLVNEMNAIVASIVFSK